MATIILPLKLIPFAKNQSQLEVAGKTLFSVLINLIRIYPSMREQLFDARGDLVKAMNLYLNDRNVKTKNWQNIPVQQQDVISVLAKQKKKNALQIAKA